MVGNDRGSQIQPGVITTDMQIDQAGSYIVAGNVYGCLPRRGRDVLVDTSDLSIEHGNIHLLIDLVGRVDHVTALEDGMLSRVRLRKARGGARRSRGRKFPSV